MERLSVSPLGQLDDGPVRSDKARTAASVAPVCRGHHSRLSASRWRAIGQARDRGQILAHCCHIAAVEQRRTGLRIGADRRYRLRSLVRHAGRHLTQRCQPVGLPQAFTQTGEKRSKVVHIHQPAMHFFGADFINFRGLVREPLT